MSTIGSNYVIKELQRGDTIYRLEIWDTSGQEKYRAVTKLFIQNAKIVILVYSIDNKESFNVLDFWYKAVLEISGSDDVVFGVVANKADLYEDLCEEDLISEEEGRKYAHNINAIFKSISSKYDNKSICSLFDQLLDQYVRRNPERIFEQNSFKIKPPIHKKKKKSC